MSRTASSCAVVLVLLAACPDPEPGSEGEDEIGVPPPPPPECVTSLDCTSPAEPFCNDDVCVACVSDSDCPDPDLPLCVGAACVAPCTIDAQEPNDSPLSATFIGDLAVLDGNLCQGDDDWFAFTIDATTYVGISARYDGRHGDLDFELRDMQSGAGDVVGIADGDDVDYHTFEAIYRRLVSPGTYVIRVYLDSGYGGVDYQIRLDRLPHG